MVVDSEGEVVVDEVLARHSQVEREPVLKLFAGELRGRGEGGRGREGKGGVSRSRKVKIT